MTTISLRLSQPGYYLGLVLYRCFTICMYISVYARVIVWLKVSMGSSIHFEKCTSRRWLRLSVNISFASSFVKHLYEWYRLNGIMHRAMLGVLIRHFLHVRQ